MALKKKKAGAKKAPAKVRQKKLPIPGSAMHKSMALRGLIKEK
tara:strand:- start:1104 stop:1232 length:129 start_codon:yes stop_codon:yes gene_type:complete